MHNVALKATILNSFRLQLGIGLSKNRSLSVLSLRVMKELLQGPTVMHFSVLYDAIRIRCYISRSTICFSFFNFVNVEYCLGVLCVARVLFGLVLGVKNKNKKDKLPSTVL